MPLIAMLEGVRVDASAHTPESWTELKQSPAAKRMVMPLCEIQAVAKTRGSTRFFAHLELTGCKVDHGEESAQHRAMKAALRDRIDAVDGWHAFVEFPHPSREWIVDVLAESDDRRRRIAFEVQLSSQTPEKYQLRSQRYFNDHVFPIWVIPRRLEYNEIKIPVVVTGFGKSSEVPEQIADLMALGVTSDLADQDTLGATVQAILARPVRWSHGSPSDQVARHRKEEERRARARQEETLRQLQFERSVAEMNDNSAAPELAFAAHTVHTEGGPFVWATLTQCWSCEHPMMLWEAQGTVSGEQPMVAPALEIKSDIRRKRYENHPDVHKAVNRWIKETRADVEKAPIILRRSRTKGSQYSAFVCPGCDAIMGQIFISCIRVEKWSLISAPLLKKRHVPAPSAKATPAADPRRGKPQKQQPPTTEPKARNIYPRPTVPEELQIDRKKTWAELHSPEGIAEARRKFMGIRGR